MALFEKEDGKGIDIGKVLAAVGGGLSGASEAITEPAPMEVDWALVAVVGGLSLGVLLLITSKRR